jgi:hypothetical protein
MKAKAHKQEVTAALTQSLHSHVDSNKPIKAIAGTLNKLAKQLVKQQREQKKEANKAASKASRQALTEELMTLLAPQLGETLGASNKTTKALAKTVARLAEQLIEHKRKQQKKADKVAAAATAAEPKVGAQPVAARPKSIPAGLRTSRAIATAKNQPLAANQNTPDTAVDTASQA